MVSQRVRAWQVAINKGPVDYRHFGGIRGIGILYVPAQSQGDSQSAQKRGSDKIYAYRRKRTIGRRVTPVHEDAVVVTASAADAYLHNRCGVDSR